MTALPRLMPGVGIVDDSGRPSINLLAYIDQLCRGIEGADASILEAFEDLVTLNNLITTANTAITAAQAAATAANAAAAASAAATAIQNSWTSGLTITATDAGADVTITISAHTRNYANGTSVAVNGGTLTGRAYSTTYFIYYSQPSRLGGAVTYASTTVESTAAQVGDVHTVGRVLTPAAAGAPVGGIGPKPPGIEPEP